MIFRSFPKRHVMGVPLVLLRVLRIGQEKHHEGKPSQGPWNTKRKTIVQYGMYSSFTYYAMGVSFDHYKYTILCGWCLLSFECISTKGTPNGCAHEFCSSCILEWAKTCTKCPICRVRNATAKLI